MSEIDPYLESDRRNQADRHRALLLLGYYGCISPHYHRAAAGHKVPDTKEVYCILSHWIRIGVRKGRDSY